MTKLMLVLFESYPKSQKNKFVLETNNKNYLRLLFLSKIMIGISILMYLISILENDLQLIKNLNAVFVGFSLIIFLMFLFVKASKKSVDNTKNMLVLIMISIVLLWSSSLIALVPSRYEVFGTYSLIILSIASIVYLKWTTQLILHMASLVYIFTVYVIMGDFFLSTPVIPKITVIVFLNIFAWGISRLLYYNNLINFELKIQLQNQNKLVKLKVDEQTEKLSKNLLEIQKASIETAKSERLNFQLKEDLELLMNSTLEGVYGVDINENCTFVNRSFLEILGFENKEEVLGKNMHKLIHHSYEDGTPFSSKKCHLSTALIKGKHIRSDGIFWRKDGKSIPVALSSTPQIRNGEVIGAVCTFKDITERKQAMESLKYEKNLAQMYLGVVGVMILALDVEGNIILINKKGTEILGLEEKQILGMNWFDNFIPKERCKKIKDVFKNNLANNEGFQSSYENDIINSSGESRIIYWNNTVLRGRDNEIIGVLSSGEDITESKEAKYKLEESEARLASAHSIAKIGSFEFNLETQMSWASKEAYDIFGLEPNPDYVDLSPIMDLIDKNDREKVISARRDLIDGTNPYDIEFAINCKNGERKYVSSKAKLEYDINGKPIKIVGINYDITDLKKNEIALAYAANNDFLTKLWNRRYFEDNLVHYDKPENYPLTIVMADINGLKLINDAFGHKFGDELLIEAAKVITESCNEGDLIARIGGDEFVIAMPKTSEKEAEKVINTINKKCKKTKIESIELSISFGFRAKTNETEDIQDILRSAEDLMYREKLLEIPSMRSGAIETILTTLYEKDEKSEVHSRTVSSLSERLAKASGMSRQDIFEVKTAGLLHDIGKIIIPLEILIKEGKLTSEEYSVIKKHPEIGFRILNSTHDTRSLSNIVLNHHERWDGFGYPRGIKGEEIPIKARIISIADAFDAMTSERTYRDIITNEEAIQEIIDNAGTQFDPELVKVFKENFKDILKEI